MIITIQLSFHFPARLDTVGSSRFQASGFASGRHAVNTMTCVCYVANIGVGRLPRRLVLSPSATAEVQYFQISWRHWECQCAASIQEFNSTQISRKKNMNADDLTAKLVMKAFCLLIDEHQLFLNWPCTDSTAWCSEIGSLTSLDAPEFHASSNVREPI